MRWDRQLRVVTAPPFAALLALALLTITACGGPTTQANTTPATNVSSLVLPTLAGPEIHLARLRGKVVVLHLFTTWSVASQVDVEKLKTLHSKRYPDVVVLGVALDPNGRALVSPWSKGMSTSYTIGLSTASVRGGKSPLGRIRQVPTTLVINKFGRIRNRIERQLGEQELPRLVEAARRAR